MRSLFLLRHAKSDWDDSDLADFDRPLSERGLSAAPKMGKFMADNGYIPEHVLCSTAYRTRQTLNAILPFFGDVSDIDLTERIYSGGMQEYFNLLCCQESDAKSVLLIGHNPSVQGLAMALSGSGDRAMLDDMVKKYPTAGLSVINFEIEKWSQLEQGQGHLELFTTPHLIP